MVRRDAHPHRESALVAGIITALREIPGCVVRKRHGTAWGVAGDPDLYGSINGRHFEIEVKRRGEGPTPLQQARLAEWRRSGALAGVAHSVDEALSIVRPAITGVNQPTASKLGFGFRKRKRCRNRNRSPLRPPAASRGMRLRLPASLTENGTPRRNGFGTAACPKIVRSPDRMRHAPRTGQIAGT